MEARAHTFTSKKMFKELDRWLALLHLHTEECDIFEHTLLRMAEIKQFGSGTFGWNESTIYFTVGGLSPIDVKKLLLFFHANGDKSAHTTYRYFGDDHIENKIEDEEEYDRVVYRKIASSFRIDAEAFQKNILPLFKEQLLAIQKDDAAWLLPYQEASKNRLAKLVISSVPSTLHHPKHVAEAAPQIETRLCLG